MLRDVSKILVYPIDRQYWLPVAVDSTLEKPDQMRLLIPVEVVLTDKRVVRIPAGFVTDCHSIPPLLAAILPEYDNRTNLAAIVHDYLYMNWEDFAQQNKFYPALDWEPVYYSGGEERRYADQVYRNLLSQLNPDGWRNPLYYVAVRLFGGWNWRKFRKQYIRK